MDKIICVGKNYLEHAKELGEAQPDFPVLFLKPPSVLKQAHSWNEQLVTQLPIDEEVVPECELILEIGRDGYRINQELAATFIRHVTVGLDVTLRGRQRQLKERGHPWTIAKVFPDAAIIGPWSNNESLTLPFSLHCNHQRWQYATARDMIHSPSFLVHTISQFFPLCEGDIIFTGTPAGCISVQRHQRIEVSLGDKQFTVTFL